MLVLYFVLVPRLNLRRFQTPMLLGFAGMLVANLLLVTMAPGNYWLLLVSVLIEAVGLVIYSPLMESLVIISIAAEERARINAITAAIVIALTSPFGWIAGQLSEANRIYPFILNIGLFILGMFLVMLAWRNRRRELVSGSEGGEE